MVSSCCICSKVKNPLYPERSFHTIPAKEEIRKKWFGIIGRTVNYKGATVCSDHFVDKDYHEMHEYRKKKRLRSTAVPFVSMQQEEQDETVEEQSISMLDTNVNIEKSSINNSLTRKRKLPPCNFINSKIGKVFVKIDKYNMESFTERDFSSSKKWNAFLRYVAFNRREKRKVQRKSFRLKKKMETLTTYCKTCKQKI